jgi:hypothetical protein
MQAIMGTSLHQVAEGVRREAARPGDLVEHPVEFAGLLGHLDWYEADTYTLGDIKTTTSQWLGHIKTHGPERSVIWQINAYAAGLIAEGHPVRRLVIDFLARDTGEEYRWTGTFDATAVQDALDWVRQVRDTPLDLLPRDYAPDSTWCSHCPFMDTCWEGGLPDRDPRTVLYLDNPDAPAWAEKLWQARQDKADAEAREAEARGALDALRPNDEGTELADIGWRLAVRWSVSRPKRLDTAAVKAEYAKAGMAPPMKTQAEPTVKVDFVPLPEGDAA